ncbi:hypothetical protein QY702_09830 [Xanthomonas campestris pv. plantaginis]|uniref:hypothetical protein n=1 Tax=Xanthomonas campestris TaxID=339 RepID=UPI002B22B599|nr:hypothetical protein [Xanthomonas campestris]MEA9606735.1 hypothetical protein [Xanthomonas campestris pv. plantaginis]
MKTTLLLLTSLLIVSCAGGFTAQAQDAPGTAQPGSSARVQMDPYTAGKLITVLD